MYVPVPVSAQEEPDLFELESTGDIPELSSCFDYYRFGSTPVVMAGELSEVSQGADLELMATITNENPYPLTGVDVHVKVFRKVSEEKEPNGPDVVDWFVPLENVNLAALEKLEFPISWNVPEHATPGEYRFVTYVISNDRFNMHGLSFTDDIVGGQFDITVVGDEAKRSTVFDKQSVTVNGAPYYFAAYPPRVGSSPTEVSAVLVNPTDTEQTVTLVWELFGWDAAHEGNRIETTEPENIVLSPNERRVVSYTVEDEALPVYFVRASVVAPEETASILGIRFIREANSIPRFNFVGIDGFPVDDTTNVVACAHTVGISSIPNARIELVAEGTSKGIRAFLGGQKRIVKEYDGELPGDIRALVMPLTGIGDSFTITARIFAGDTLIDEVVEQYDCSQTGVPCPVDATVQITRAGLLLMYITAAAIAVIVVRRIIRTRRLYS
jgi:hypothetical protein